VVGIERLMSIDCVDWISSDLHFRFLSHMDVTSSLYNIHKHNTEA
jgi:hypothetical protein